MMKPTLTFEVQEKKMSDLGVETSIPDLLGGLILQNDLQFDLEEEDEIFEGYGTKKNSFPYRQYNSYTRELKTKEVRVAVLENDFLKAVFLPDLGGRLWELIDKKTGTNLLYTNDVIRFSNLAIRNAWFSGGVEWNLGIIGHTPLTTEPLFTATLEDEEGNPVLRMYEYERIRGVEYQMDFWLGEKDTRLNCRMRIVNSSKEVVPMYWWSNMAVPEYKGGRIVVPASKAFTYREGEIRKVSVPMVEGVDVSHYEQIPQQVDYFFDIPKESPKYIANINAEGYGLFHTSTSRLQSRKLFSWGNNISSSRWQGFLTENAGRYIEIQAGLGKTQYGCIPMPPHSAWEWMEQYGPIQLNEKETKMPFDELKEVLKQRAYDEFAVEQMEETLEQRKQLAKTRGEKVYEGSAYGALKQACREMENDRSLSPHLNYGSCEEKQQKWIAFLKTGILHTPDKNEVPEDFMWDDIFYKKLEETIEKENAGNWYAHYHMGLGYFIKDNYELARKHWKKSLELDENAWAYHGLATIEILQKDYQTAKETIQKGLAMRKTDLSYLKETFKYLQLCEAYQDMIALYQGLNGEMQAIDRLVFYYIYALHQVGRTKEAYDLLMKDGGLELADIREGEDSIGQLWADMYQTLYGEEKEIPYQFQFNSFL